MHPGQLSWLVFSVNLTQPRVTWKEGASSTAEFLNQTGVWLCLREIVVADDWGGRVQCTINDTPIPGRKVSMV